MMRQCVFCLLFFLFCPTFGYAQTGLPLSSVDEVLENEASTDEGQCDVWAQIAYGHWNDRVNRLRWKYPDAPWFGDLPEEVQAFLISGYCKDGVDWVSDNPEVVRNIMERKWPVSTVK